MLTSTLVFSCSICNGYTENYANNIPMEEKPIYWTRRETFTLNWFHRAELWTVGCGHCVVACVPVAQCTSSPPASNYVFTTQSKHNTELTFYSGLSLVLNKLPVLKHQHLSSCLFTLFPHLISVKSWHTNPILTECFLSWCSYISIIVSHFINSLTHFLNGRRAFSFKLLDI